MAEYNTSMKVAGGQSTMAEQRILMATEIVFFCKWNKQLWKHLSMGLPAKYCRLNFTCLVVVLIFNDECEKCKWRVPKCLTSQMVGIRDREGERRRATQTPRLLQSLCRADEGDSIFFFFCSFWKTSGRPVSATQLKLSFPGCLCVLSFSNYPSHRLELDAGPFDWRQTKKQITRVVVYQMR